MPDHHDMDEFAAARERLGAELQQWCQAQGRDADARSDAELFLDWRWGYSTGELLHFEPRDVREYLLEWCPRKVSAVPERWLDIPRALTTYVDFLTDTGRLVGGPAAARRLTAAVADATPRFLDHMADPARHGMAKSIFAGAGLGIDDVDLDDPRSIQDVMERFNALPFDERKAITDRFVAADPHPIELPLTLAPGRTEVIRSAEAAPVLALLERLRTFLGAGRALTAKGNLKVADGRALVELLETRDIVDVEGVRTVRSSEQLPRLAFLLAWAKEVRAVRVRKGRLVPVKGWEGRSALEQATTAVEALLELGPLWTTRRNWGWFADLHAFLDDGVPHWLVPLLVEAGQHAVDDLLEVVTEAALEGLASLPDWYASDPERLAELLSRDVSYILEMLDRAGIVTWTGWEAVPDRWGLQEERIGGHLALTPFGRHALPPILERCGYRVPILGDVSCLDGSGLVRAALDVGENSLDALWDQWMPGRSGRDRAQGLSSAALDAEAAGERVMAFELLSRLEEDAVPTVRDLLDGPLAGHAALWLLGRGVATEEEMASRISLQPLVDLLAWATEEGDEGLVAAYDESVPDEQRVGLMDELWRVDQPETLGVLEALGRAHPDKRVAKAARKAAFRRRSWQATRPH